MIPVANKSIVLAFHPDTYDEVVEDKQAFKTFLNAQIEAYPELFPDSIQAGWSLYGFTKDSVKQGIRTRRILTKADNEVWQIHPSFMMPYMTCDTATAEQILFLSKWVPLWSNFRPYAYNPIAGYKERNTRSPFEQLNGFTYHDCWLQNMLVATSKQEIYRFQHKKL